MIFLGQNGNAPIPTYQAFKNPIKCGFSKSQFVKGLIFNDSGLKNAPTRLFMRVLA
jgi:hypothetical protein